MRAKISVGGDAWLIASGGIDALYGDDLGKFWNCDGALTGSTEHTRRIVLDASRSSAIYKSMSTVQSPALQVIVAIRY